MHRRMRIEPADSRQVEFSQTLRKFRKMSGPNCVCSTSGWNCRPNRGRSRCRIAWTLQFGELARGEARRNLRHLVVVGLPHLEPVGKPFEEDIRLVNLDDGFTKLRDLRRSRRPSQVGRHELVACADPKDGSAEGVEVFAVLAHLLRIDADAGGASAEEESADLLQI